MASWRTSRRFSASCWPAGAGAGAGAAWVGGWVGAGRGGGAAAGERGGGGCPGQLGVPLVAAGRVQAFARLHSRCPAGPEQAAPRRRPAGRTWRRPVGKQVLLPLLHQHLHQGQLLRRPRAASPEAQNVVGGPQPPHVRHDAPRACALWRDGATTRRAPQALQRQPLRAPAASGKRAPALTSGEKRVSLPLRAEAGGPPSPLLGPEPLLDLRDQMRARHHRHHRHHRDRRPGGAVPSDAARRPPDELADRQGGCGQRERAWCVRSGSTAGSRRGDPHAPSAAAAAAAARPVRARCRSIPGSQRCAAPAARCARALAPSAGDAFATARCRCAGPTDRHDGDVLHLGGRL